ncbi:MAG: DNA primase, partial [Acidimicrobiia bacterium]|nr:DNA primase [Acidimicrobiia bacterium]
MAYPREDIDKVRDATDLAELAAEVTKVKRSGRSTMAVCPFHQEKTPSLSIDASRGLYHCFGCGKSGDVFRWVQETQGTDFVGALEMLARRAGVVLTEDPEASKRRDRRELLVGATETAVDFYLDRLKTGDDAGAARAYLRSRGYDGDVVEQFKIGYSPDSWDALVRHLGKAGFSDDVMITAGLASRARTGKPVDRFRGRVMFPIYDVRGDAVGFGARVLDGDGPKYLNSPE